MGSVMKERISQIKAILSDLKDGMLLKEETGDWSSQGAIQMRSCLGKILLLIRAMREKIAEGDEFSDQVRATNAEILSRCYQQIKRLYLVLPLGESAGKINKADHIIFQVNVETVIFELETVLGEAPIKTLGHINTDKESTEASPLDELNDLRRKLINAEIRRELELIGHKLMLSKERTFVLQARKEQHAAELRLAEEQDRVRKLKKSLSKSKLKLKVISEQNEELMGYQNRWIEQREPKENLQVEQRKCRMFSQGRNCVNMSSRQNQSEQGTLKNLKHQLGESKVTFVNNKTTMSDIKKVMDELCFEKRKLLLGIKGDSNFFTNSEVSKMRHLRKQTLNVIDKLLRAFFYYNRLKFPECSVKWSQLLKSLQSNLIIVRERWKRTSLRNQPAPETKVAFSGPTQQRSVCSFKNEGPSFLKQPVKYPQLSEFLWDKIYKSGTESTPCLVRDLSKENPHVSVNKRTLESSTLASNLFRPTSVPKYLGKTFGDPSRSVASIPVNGRPSVASVASNVSKTNSTPKHLGKTFGDRRLKLLRWCKRMVQPYGLPMYEFSDSWTSGRALCAIIHSHRPELIEQAYIQKKSPKETLTYGVNIAQSLGVGSSNEFIAECLRKHPNFQKIVDFVEELQCCLQSPD